jgi:hypothetical protein
MTGSNNGPFLNEDAIVAVGLAFAGMAVLQSKLLPAFSGLNGSLLSRLLDSRVLEWWPVLLIAGGVWVWIKEKRRRTVKSISLSGDNR